jgi:hypothetical protein
MLAMTQRAAPPPQPQEAMRLVRGAFAADVVAGLSAREKTPPAKYFCDALGSELFEAICRTPEYYPTLVARAGWSVTREWIGSAPQFAIFSLTPGSNPFHVGRKKN